MSIVDGTGLVEWEGGLFEPGSDLLRRVRWAFAQIRAAGGSITLNEAGRPYGVPGDQYVRNASDTASGRSTVWYQWGRYQRGETPSAANPAAGPYASEHTQGIAIDCNVSDLSLRARYFGLVGLSNTISSESWHWAIRGPSQVDLSAYADLDVTPIAEEKREIMARVINRQSTGVDYVVSPGFIKAIPDERTRQVAEDSYGNRIPYNDDDFRRCLNDNGIPLDVVKQISVPSIQGWSAGRGVFAESDFGTPLD